MPVWELTGYCTDSRQDRCREYTTSERKAAEWGNIPRIDFTDSGHGIVFRARQLAPSERRKPTIRRLEHADLFLRDPARFWEGRCREFEAAEQAQRQRAAAAEHAPRVTREQLVEMVKRAWGAGCAGESLTSELIRAVLPDVDEVLVERGDGDG